MTRKQRPFPRDTLEKALKIAGTIQDQNNGEPMKRIFVADHLKIKPESSNFRYLVSSSHRYGLTKGGAQAEYLSLTPLGESIAKIKDERQKIPFLQEALQKVKVFKDFYQRYRDARLPSDDYAKNLLKDEFKVPEEHLDECLNLIITNGRFTEIIQDVAGAPRVVFERAPSIPSEEKIEKKEKAEVEEKFEEIEEKEIPEEVKKPRVFISHSKNKKIVKQIKQILDFGQFENVIAEERETTAIPIPEKVFGLMRNCDCAIINVSADEQEKREDGTYGINQNVLIEIGAAFLMYNKKVILLVDKRIELPSNLQGLYRCEYKGDELTFNTAMKLQKALSEFRK